LSIHERLICSEELGNRHQTPTLIGCMLLTNPQEHPALRLLFLPTSLRSAKPSFLPFRCDPLLSLRLAVVISEALDSIPTFHRLPPLELIFFRRLRLPLSLRRHQQSPQL
jgi:hypothetical protein